MKKIVLASNSPRREFLLKLIGLDFIIYPSNIEEDEGEDKKSPKEVVLRNALEKAKAVSQVFNSAIIISADTIVVLDGKILGKPKDKESAINMLKKLRGKTHQVFTGVVVWETPENRYFTRVVKSLVKMRNYSMEEIINYVETGEPMDKAGAYGIQGKGALLIEKIEGDYYNIVGLPLAPLYLLLKKVGVRIF
ncbi:MAG: Maf family protein [Dictyoglomus sp.]|nr:Maf family protein [Dictyoglomus sp.]MCX7941741.1 Maf family protein [Dictyoglomaceae bacterium]MDW8189034.1 nucleoside triphosphate pyrophosphatase [Dictyoglomus sp.]